MCFGRFHPLVYSSTIDVKQNTNITHVRTLRCFGPYVHCECYRIRVADASSYRCAYLRYWCAANTLKFNENKHNCRRLCIMGRMCAEESHPRSKNIAHKHRSKNNLRKPSALQINERLSRPRSCKQFTNALLCARATWGWQAGNLTLRLAVRYLRASAPCRKRRTYGCHCDVCASGGHDEGIECTHSFGVFSSKSHKIHDLFISIWIEAYVLEAQCYTIC